MQNIEWLIRIGYYGNADLGAAAASDEHLSSWGSSAVELLDPLDTPTNDTSNIHLEGAGESQPSTLPPPPQFSLDTGLYRASASASTDTPPISSSATLCDHNFNSPRHPPTHVEGQNNPLVGLCGLCEVSFRDSMLLL